MYCSLEAIAATLSTGKKKLASFAGSCCQVSPPLSVNLATGRMNVLF